MEEKYEYKFMELEKVGHVLKITMNRVEAMNSISKEMDYELNRIIDEGEADPDIHCMVITGNKHFGVGYDIATQPGEKRDLDPEKFEFVGDFIAYWQELDAKTVEKNLKLFHLKTPVIAAVDGYCLGGSMWIAMSCDMIFAAETAVFGQPEVRHGSCSSFLIPALAGRIHASRWLLTGDHFDGKEAERIGLVNECLPTDQFMDKVMQVAERVSKVPPLSARYMKSMIMQGTLAAGLASGLKYSAPLATLGHTAHSKERAEMLKIAEKEGLKAFLEKRDGPFLPEFMGPKSKVKRHIE